jgi:hypothetical protein
MLRLKQEEHFEFITESAFPSLSPPKLTVALIPEIQAWLDERTADFVIHNRMEPRQYWTTYIVDIEFGCANLEMLFKLTWL